MNKNIKTEIAIGVLMIVFVVVIGLVWLIHKEIEWVSMPVVYQPLVMSPCRELNISQEQIDIAIAESIQGIQNPWGNEGDFQLLINRIETKLQCTLEKNLIISIKQSMPITQNTFDNWETYHNGKYGFEFKYPKDFIKQRGASEENLLYLKKEEVGSTIFIRIGIKKDFQINKIASNLNAKEVFINGKKGYKYFFREGVGYSGVFLFPLKDDVLELVYDYIGGESEKTLLENLVSGNFEEILSTFKFT